MTMLQIDVVTVFPEYLDPLRQALPGKAIEAGIFAVGVHDLRRLDPRCPPLGR